MDPSFLNLHSWLISLLVLLTLCYKTRFSSVQSLSPVWLCDPMECSMPGLPVHHQLPELSQTHVHRVGDAIHPSHPLSSPSPPAFNLSQHQGLFQWVSSSHQSIGVSPSASVLPMNIQDWSPWGWTGWISLQSKGLSTVFSNSTVQKHQFFGAQLSLVKKAFLFVKESWDKIRKVKTHLPIVNGVSVYVRTFILLLIPF